MSKKERTQKEIAKAIEKIISDVNTVLSAVKIMNGYSFFNRDEFNKKGFDKLIKDKCKEFDINELRIREIAGW